MAEYIEREALLNAIDTSLNNNTHEFWVAAKMHDEEHKHFLCMTRAQPTADVVEIEKVNQLLQENKVLKKDIETLRKYIKRLQIGKKEGAEK